MGPLVSESAALGVELFLSISVPQFPQGMRSQSWTGVGHVWSAQAVRHRLLCPGAGRRFQQEEYLSSFSGWRWALSEVGTCRENLHWNQSEGCWETWGRFRKATEKAQNITIFCITFPAPPAVPPHFGLFYYNGSLER